jgi:hypothetical protein
VERLARSGRNGLHAGMTQIVRGVKRASGNQSRASYAPARGNLEAAKREEQTQSSPGAETAEGQPCLASSGDSSKGWNASRNIAAYFFRS